MIGLVLFPWLFLPYLAQGQVITDMGDSIFVDAAGYKMVVQKQTAEVSLKNSTGQRYTRFPLLAYATNSFSTTSLGYSWQVGGSEIELTARDTTESRDVLQAIVRCFNQDFEVQFAVLPAADTLGQVSWTQEWGTLGLDVSVERNPLKIGGQQYPKGLGTHAYSQIIMQLPQPCTDFLAQVGVDDEVGNDHGTVVFQVFTDGSKVYDSGLLRGSDQPVGVSVALEGVSELKLIVTTGGDNNWWDHADWAMARLVKASGDTLYISDWIRSLMEQVNLFCSDSGGVETNGWTKMFTPEPDNFYSSGEVGVDLLDTRDGKRYFAPAPLNLSFQTPAGWFSVGLCELPDATRFVFSSNYFFIDYAWSKMEVPTNQLYWITPLCFTFNEDEWQAISDYRNYLLNHEYIVDPSMEERNIPQWWMEPLVCTWGEQLAQGIWMGSPGFNTNWVRGYVQQQEEKLGYQNFTLILDDKWQKFYGDPNPDPNRFGDLRDLIDELHTSGHHVLLWWKCWHGEPGSLPQGMGITENGLIDATNPQYIDYVQTCMDKMLGDGPGCLDADGFKMDYIFDIRDPQQGASYADPSEGIGLRELYRYLDIWYTEAKQVKSECLITFSGPDPHFASIQDMTRLNDGDGTHTTYRWQNRARVSSQAAPNLLIDGDGCDMYRELLFPHAVTSSVYGTPSLYFLTEFSDGQPITDEELEITGKIFSLAAMKHPGKAVYKGFDHWQMRDDGGLIAESMQYGSSLVVYPDSNTGYALTTKNQDLLIPLHGGTVTQVLADTQNVDFLIEGDDLKIPSAIKGQIYQIEFASTFIGENRGSNLPKSYDLSQNYPNPFNSSTVIRYQLPRDSMVLIEVYDVLGHLVRRLVNRRQRAGEYEVTLVADRWASGLYFCRLKTEDFTKTNKMILLK